MNNKTCLLGFASVMALVAVGCAGEPAGATVERDGVAIQPIAGDELAAAAEQPLPGAVDPGATPSLDRVAVEGPAAAVPVIPACAFSAPSATSMARAERLAECVHGALTEAEVGRHFKFTPAPGVSYLLELARPGDARFDLGVPGVVDGVERCVALSTGLLAARVTTDGTAGPLCAVVRSATGEAQPFTLTAAR